MNISSFAADNFDVVLPVCNGTNEISLLLRPFVYEFLEDVKTKFELILYSSLKNEYLIPIANYLEKIRLTTYFVHRFDENFCLFANISSGIKCLDFLLENRRAQDIIVVDCTPKSLPLNPNNFIPIKRYEGIISGSKQDNELVKLSVILDNLSKVDDAREVIKKFRYSMEKK